MKIVSKEHFKRMEIICKKFHSNSKNGVQFLSEYEVSSKINKMIHSIHEPTQSDFEIIVELIENIDNTEHYDGSQWFDYKVHLNAVLLENGFESSII